MRVTDQDLSRIGFTFHLRGHFRPVICGLLEAGFRVTELPTDGLIHRNAQIIELHVRGRKLRFRVFVYKVTVSSRGRPHERRVEITNTYPRRNLSRIQDAKDVVLGWDYQTEVFVGLDPRRLEHGGPTGNASSFFDEIGLREARPKHIRVLPHRSQIFPRGFEYHAFFKRESIADYLVSLQEIHANTYDGETFLAGKRRIAPLRAAPKSDGHEVILSVGKEQRRKKISSTLVKSFEQGRLARRRRKMSSEVFAQVKKTCEENGRLGEEFVLEYEKRQLLKAGHPNLAAKVQWTSETSVFEGYDILSFFEDGKRKYIEVKSTSGEGNVFQITINEWNFGIRHASQYILYRVKQVTSKRPRLKTYCDLKALEASGQIAKLASGWTITLH